MEYGKLNFMNKVICINLSINCLQLMLIRLRLGSTLCYDPKLRLN